MAAFIDRQRPRLPAAALNDATWREQDRYNARILGPWKVWPTATGVSSDGAALLTWSSTSSPQPAIGNGTLYGAWREFGDLVLIHLYLGIDSSTTLGTGFWSFSLPFPAVDTIPQAIPGVLHASTLASRYTISAYCGTGIIDRIDYTGGQMTDVAPFALSTGDKLIVEGFYRPV